MAAGEEKILVSVRVRPLNEKEKVRNDGCDWECINNNTIICKYHNLPDKPTYTYDKVFGFETPTKQVYNDGAREVALCVLSGINSSIFAYGQTSSGKTYTMSGITEFAMDDIFNYIEKHKQEREFTLKFSAMEIYNEAVRDLLCEDNNTPLRLLDDPERGTVVEKLKEETLTDKNHLMELLSICETQRKIGETSLNETSSRSHQILRLTIESSGREFSPESSATLAASVCFVDLAGSERASQTLSAGSRLKEGCHINRSLLTLGTVIRKLSKGKSGHIPYRDSKLTRILQNSLGGNARTAIICTMSPARIHLEQSRNTLLFASCAKEVTTNAQVNLVVSQKALVKQLQRELARMENELKNLGPASSSASTSEFYALLKQKEELISKMEEQIQELKFQRDVAQSQVENLLKSTMEERSYTSSGHNRRISYDSTDFDEPHMLNYFGKRSFCSPDEDAFLLEDTIPQFPQHEMYDKWEELAPRTTQKTENACKEVRYIEVEGQEKSGETESLKIQDSLEDIVDKKVDSLSAEREYKSSVVNEKAENEGTDMKREDIELSSKLEAEGELTVKKLVDSQDNETSMEKENENTSWSAQKLEAKDEPSVEKLVTTEETQKSVEKEDKNMSWSAQKLGAKDVRTIEKLVTSEEIEQVVGREDKNMSWSAQKLGAKDEITIEKLVTSEEIVQSVEKEDKNMSWSEQNLVAKDELSIEKSQETEKSVEKEDKNMNCSAQKQSKKEHMEPNSWKAESEQLTKSLSEEEQYDDDTYESLKKKVKEMQKTIEYFMSMQSAEEKQSPSFNISMSPTDYLTKTDDKMSPRDYLKMKKSRSCRENLLFTRGSSSSERFTSKVSNTSFDSDDTGDTHSTKDSDYTETSHSSFHEFLAGLKKSAMQHESTPEHDHIDTEAKKMKPDNRKKAEFERQQSQIIELWEVCNVPLVHRTYFFLLFKGDPSDFVYMEVELRRLSFLKDSPETLKRQSAKALAREREWLAKQIPKKYGKKQREEVYQKWDVELSSKQRSMQVSNKLWTDTNDLEHSKESASLVASLVGFVDSNLTPKEMFGLSISPTIFNIKPSGWRLTNSFSRI